MPKTLAAMTLSLVLVSVPIPSLAEARFGEPDQTAEQPAASAKQDRTVDEELQAVRKELNELRALLERQQPGSPRSMPLPLKPVSIEGAPSKGSPEAPFVLIEYADFECRFCRDFGRETLPQLEREFVATGKLRYVFRNFPLEHAHPEAFNAAVWAECAGRQQKFWELHDRILGSDQSLDATVIEQYAKDVGLNLAEARQCITGDARDKIRAETEAAWALGVNATPTLLIGEPDGRGTIRVRRLLHGAQPFAVVKSILYSLTASRDLPR